GDSRHLTVGGQDSDGKKSGDQIEKVFGNKYQEVLGEKVEVIQGNNNLVIGTDEAAAFQLVQIAGSKWEQVTGTSIYLVGKAAWDNFKDTYHVTCARMWLNVKSDDYLIEVQRHSTHKVKTGDYLVQTETGQLTLL